MEDDPNWLKALVIFSIMFAFCFLVGCCTYLRSIGMTP